MMEANPQYQLMKEMFYKSMLPSLTEIMMVLFILGRLSKVFVQLGVISSCPLQGKFPSLLFPIEVKNIQKAKHGSDSGVYDSEGRFVESKFEDIFIKYAKENSNALTKDELMEMVKANREHKDYAGRTAAYLEWKILYDLGKDNNGLLQKDTIRGVYDGSLFEKLEKDKAIS